MTYPITPDPSIHSDLASNSTPTDPSAMLSSITQLFTEIPKIIIEGAIAFIKEVTGIDLTSVEQFFDSFISLIESGGASALDFVRSILQPLVDAIIAVLGPIPIVGSVIETLASFLGLTHTTANTAQTTATAAQTTATTAQTTATTAQTTATTANTNLLSGFQNIFNQWFGGSTAVGTPTEVAVTVDSIRVLTKDGYTVQTFTTSNASWTVDPGLASAEVAWAGAINGGGKGQPGGTATNSILAVAYGGNGGVDGGYRLAKVDPTTLGSTLAIVIGAASTVNGTAGGTTSIGSLVTGTPGVSGIDDALGYSASTSKAGTGGRGGDSWNLQGTSIISYPGFTGEPSATAAGGAAGSASNGGNGNSGNTSSLPLSGGSGGGGGAGHDGNFVTGFSGGNGGYPGGGSGGGGGSTSSVNPTTAGPSGTPAAGFAFLIWK